MREYLFVVCCLPSVPAVFFRFLLCVIMLVLHDCNFLLLLLLLFLFFRRSVASVTAVDDAGRRRYETESFRSSCGLGSTVSSLSDSDCSKLARSLSCSFTRLWLVASFFL